MDCDLETSIPDWIIEHPEASSVFQELGLDVSCGGKSLAWVATSSGLDPQSVLHQLRAAIDSAAADSSAS